MSGTASAITTPWWRASAAAFVGPSGAGPDSACPADLGPTLSGSGRGGTIDKRSDNQRGIERFPQTSIPGGEVVFSHSLPARRYCSFALVGLMLALVGRIEPDRAEEQDEEGR